MTSIEDLLPTDLRGNRNMASWKMIGYPGLPATYREEIRTYFGKKYDKPPHSIADFS
jgi:gluconate 2-dehydrogenase gamma chain